MRTRKTIRSCRPGLLGRLPAYLLGAVLSAGMVFSVNTYAVHDLGVFELDNGTKGANAIDETNIGNADASAPDDWAQTGNNCGGLASCGYVSGPTVDTDNPGGSAFKSLFIQDPNGVANTDDIFTGGGSKDDLDVKQWLTKRGSTPDKDDLLPIGAAAYLEDLTDDDVDNPDLLIYLFGTLFAPNGDAAIGAWLFKKDIGICDDGIGGADTDPFGVVDSNGNCLPAAQQPLNLHTIGDVFVVAQNTNGGRNVIMEIYKWVDENNAQGQDTAAATAAKAACVDIFPNSNKGGVIDGTLCMMFAAQDAHCDTLNLHDDNACGTMNLGATTGKNAQPAVPTESPDDWGFQSKFPPANGPASPGGTDGIQSDDFPGTSLFEAGFNFTNLFPGAVGCFNSFLMNTRASQSVDAVLKDIGLGKFPLCGISVSKSGPEKSKIGDDADFTFTITNTGAITLYLDTIVDDVLGDLEADAPAACDTLAAQASCTFTVTRAIPAGSPDPLVNTVTVHYNSAQSLQGDDQTSTASHETNLFQPAVLVTKTGDATAMVGDSVDYTIVVTNTGSSDSPDLVVDSIVDTLLGNLLAANANVTANGCIGNPLASGANNVGESCTITASRTVLAEDPDPLPNTVTVHYHPQGFPNDITDDDSHSVDLFQPSVTLDKTGDTLSKPTDKVKYTITVTNTSSTDTPDLDCVITDEMLGISEPVTLAAGADPVVLTPEYTVQENDPDPLVNTASVTCSVNGVADAATATDDHSVNLFYPAVTVEKSGTELTKVGDPAEYTIVVSNTGSADSPNLVNGTIVDTLLGDLLDGANPYVTSSDCTATLATGASCTITATRTVLEGDEDPLPNTVTVHYNPDDFPNDITDSDDHSVNLFQPLVDVVKTANCAVDVILGQSITYTYVITNKSSDDSPALINGSVVDSVLGDLLDGTNTYVTSSDCSTTLATDATCTIVAEYLVDSLPPPNPDPLAEDPNPLINTVDVHYNPDGFTNDISAQDQQSCNVVLPNPATVVIEKVLINAENLPFGYSTTGDLPVPSFSLTPLYGQLPLDESPFDAPLAGQSFADSIAYTVDIPTFGATKVVTVTETLPLPPFISAVDLDCSAAVDGTLNGQSVNGLTATLTLGSGDFAFCRYVNQFTPGDEGCTPGFWKQVQHFGHWLPTGYLPVAYQGSPATLLQDVFDFSGVTTTANPNDLEVADLADDTMLAALSYPGGKGKYGAAQILLRAAVAAVLNASSVQYPIAKADVIAQVNAALSSNNRDTMLALATTLDNANNGVLLPDGGGTEDCPLSGQLYLP